MSQNTHRDLPTRICSGSLMLAPRMADAQVVRCSVCRRCVRGRSTGPCDAGMLAEPHRSAPLPQTVAQQVAQAA